MFAVCFLIFNISQTNVDCYFWLLMLLHGSFQKLSFGNACCGLDHLSTILKFLQDYEYKVAKRFPHFINFKLRYLPFGLYTIIKNILFTLNYSTRFSLFSLGIALTHYWLVLLLLSPLYWFNEESHRSLKGFPPNLGDSNKDFRALSCYF